MKTAKDFELKNFEIIWDGIYSHIVTTSQLVEEHRVFSTLEQAKKYLIKDFQTTIRDYKDAMQRTKDLTLEDFYTIQPL